MSFTHHRLGIARLAAGLSQEELAEASGVPLKTIQAAEAAPTPLDEAAQVSLAEALRIDALYLQKQGAPLEVGSASNTIALLDEPMRDMLLARIRIWLERSLDLEYYMPAEDFVMLEYPQGFPAEIATREDAVAAAYVLRAAWDMSSLPIGQLVSWLELHGVRLAVMPPLPNFDALALVGHQDLTLPLIVYNGALLPEHQRWAICRELAWFFLAELDQNEEPLADYFATAFLMPGSAAFRLFGEKRSALSLLELYRAKQLYGISIETLVNWLADIDIITVELADQWVAYLTGLDPAEQGRRLPTEVPQHLMRIALKLQASGVLTESQAAGFLGLPDFVWDVMTSLQPPNVKTRRRRMAVRKA